MSSNVPDIPLWPRPRYWRALAAVESVAVAALVVTVFVTLSGPPQSVGTMASAYETLLVAVVFVAPAVAGLFVGALNGGLLRALELAAFPSLAWTLSIPVGYGFRQALGYPLPSPDSPFWAIGGAFLLIGLTGGCVGFAVGRGGWLLWRRSNA